MSITVYESVCGFTSSLRGRGSRNMRVQGWDPLLIICQIISLQTLHYLTLSLITPMSLSLFTPAPTLAYSGGASAVSHILDWRELAARPTVSSSSFSILSGMGIGLDSAASGWKKLRGAWAGGKHVGSVEGESTDGTSPPSNGSKGASGVPVMDDLEAEMWDMGVDEKRGWVLAVLWIVASAIDILPLYHLIRRPTYILDFSLTLNLIHLILTTYFAGAFPTSIFYWVVQALGALLMVSVAEQREMRTQLGGIEYDPNFELDLGQRPDDIEMGQASK